jgi:hypothetical protein
MLPRAVCDQNGADPFRNKNRSSNLTERALPSRVKSHVDAAGLLRHSLSCLDERGGVSESSGAMTLKVCEKGVGRGE